MAEKLVSLSEEAHSVGRRKERQRSAFENWDETERSGNLTVDLIRDSTPQGVNGEFPVVSSGNNDALEIVSKR
jgi:hypothetical protein